MNPPADKKHIILDTNFFQYRFHPKFGQKIDKFIDSYKERNFNEAACVISIFECVKVARPGQADKLLSAMKDIYRYKIDEKILEFAGYLHNFYQKDNAIKGRISGISTEDLIIASTAVLNNALIATGDGNDFPRPFFEEVDQVELYSRDPKPQIIVGYLLEANRSVIDHHLAHRDSTGKHQNVLTREWE